MNGFDNALLGKVLVVIGVLAIVAGLFLIYAGKIPFLGRLPGDISISRPNFSFHFPIMTSIIISIVLTLILYLLRRH